MLCCYGAVACAQCVSTRSIRFHLQERLTELAGLMEDASKQAELQAAVDEMIQEAWSSGAKDAASNHSRSAKQKKADEEAYKARCRHDPRQRALHLGSIRIAFPAGRGGVGGALQAAFAGASSEAERGSASAKFLYRPPAPPQAALATCSPTNKYTDPKFKAAKWAARRPPPVARRLLPAALHSLFTGRILPRLFHRIAPHHFGRRSVPHCITLTA